MRHWQDNGKTYSAVLPNIQGQGKHSAGLPNIQGQRKQMWQVPVLAEEKLYKDHHQLS